MVQKGASAGLNVTMAGVQFRSPIGVAAVGNHWGKELYEKPELHAEMNAKVLLGHARAGAGYIYLSGAYLTEATLKKLRDRARMEEEHPPHPGGLGLKVMKAETQVAPYGVEGLYFLASPFFINPKFDKALTAKEKMMAIIKEKKPEDVPIIVNVIGFGDLPDTYVDGAKRWEELGADLIELNLSCPFPAGMKGAVDDFSQKRFPARFQGALIGDNPDLVEKITKEVVKAVRVPVGIKLSPETGFPRIVGLAKKIREAGAKFVQATNSAVGIAPPDIYNRGKPLWPFTDGNPFCMASGSWLRILCYRNVAAIAKFVPGIDIAAAGGIVMPQHCVEVMMLGARHVQLCTGVIEQGRNLIRQSNEFIRKFMVEQGYRGVEDFVGLGQQYVKYQEEVVIARNVVAELDEAKCTKCGYCLDNICTALYSDHGKIKVSEEKCAGCGGCIVTCRSGALKLVLKD